MSDDSQDFVIRVTTDLQQASRGLDGLMRLIEGMTQSGGERFGLLDKAISGIGSTVVATMARFNGWMVGLQALLKVLDQVLEIGGKMSAAIGLDDAWDGLTSAIADLGETASGALKDIGDRAMNFGKTSINAAGDTNYLTEAMERVTEKATAAVRATQAFFASLQNLDSRSESALRAQIEVLEQQRRQAERGLSTHEQSPLSRTFDEWLGRDSGEVFKRKIGEIDQEIATLTARLWALGTAVQEVGFDGIVVPGIERSIQALRNQNRELETQITTFGMTAAAAARYRTEMQLLDKLGDEDGLPRHERMEEARGQIDQMARNAQTRQDMEEGRRAYLRAWQREDAASERTERIFTSGEGRVEQITAQARALTMQAGAAAELAAQERLTLQLRQAQIPVTDEMLARIQELAQAEGRATENLRSMQRQMQMMQDVGRTFGTAMERAFGDWITGAETDWNRLFQGLARDLAILALRTSVIQPLFGGGASGGTGLIGTLLSGLLPGRASGGPVQAGRPYMVGEQGPEPFIPTTDGFILPNGAMQGGGGVVEMNMTLNLEGANGDEAIARIAGEAARRHAVAAVEQADANFPARQRRFQLLGH